MRLIQRRAYGFKNFENYRLRVKVLCASREFEVVIDYLLLPPLVVETPVLEPVLEGGLSSKLGVGDEKIEICLGIVQQLRTKYSGYVRVFGEISLAKESRGLIGA